MLADISSALYYRVSDLPTAEPLDGSEVIEVIQDGKNVKLSVAQFGLTGQDSGAKVLRINTSTDDLFFGQPVYSINNASVAAADASDENKKVVTGLVSYPIITSNGGEGHIQTTGVLVGTIAQWEVATGMVGGLVAKLAYYLDSHLGRISPFAPSQAGQFLTEIGTAISPTELSISIERPISL